MILPALAIAIAAAAVPAQAAKPFSPDQAKQVRCVAALAVVASDQQRDAGEWDGYPPLAQDGAAYAGIVTDRLMKETGRTADEMHDEMLKAVADLQKQATDSGDPEGLAHAEADRCLPLMRAVVPAKPKPNLPQCAAYIGLAYEEVRVREAGSDTTRMLATIASVLDHRAREMLQGEGKSGSEVDEAMGLEKERIAAETKKSAGAAPAVDLQHCFTLAAPDKR